MFTRNSDQSHIMFITKQIFNYQQNKTFRLSQIGGLEVKEHWVCYTFP